MFPSINFIVLLLFFVVTSVHALITCTKCELTSDNCQFTRDTCTGDYCFHSQYFYGSEIFSSTQKGCIIGEVPSEGCRINHHGNVMCFCGDSDYCNTNLTSIADQTTQIIPVQTCQPLKINSTPQPRWVKPCAGNFCTFLASKVDMEGSNYTWANKDCNQENDFDIFPTFTVFNLYPGNCVWLQYGGQPSAHACYGSNDLDTTLTIPTEVPQIQCHVDYFSPRLPYVRTGDTCTGQFCFISATSRGEVYRGCVSSANVEAATTLKIGYTRSFTGLEQWICDQNDCNADLKSAEMSWPPELYLYRNISNLREFNVFYIASARHTPAFFLTFFLTTIPIYVPFF